MKYANLHRGILLLSGSLHLTPPMLFALGFVVLFTIGGFTNFCILSTRSTDDKRFDQLRDVENWETNLPFSVRVVAPSFFSISPFRYFAWSLRDFDFVQPPSRVVHCM
jgi:Heme/copper-type cytochrome/quinol oxidases, subunit 1